MNTMKLNTMKLAIPLFVAIAYGPSQGLAAPIMGSDLASFAVLGATTVTNTGNTTLTGNLGVSPGSAIKGFYGTTLNDGPGTFTGSAYQGSTTIGNAAQTQLGAAITSLGLLGPGTTVSGDLTGLTLTPGTYTVPYAASNLTGALTLNGLGKTNQTWVFQMPSSLITSVGSTVNLINMGAGDSIYWDVGSSATIKSGTSFAGNILAYTSIALGTGATILDGSALAYTGAVTLNANHISISPVPEPGIWTMMLSGLGLIGFIAYRRKDDSSNMLMAA